jgi:hypothetical protein
MTEAEWDVCTDPTPMLEFLRGKASDRKLWLFSYACCGRLDFGLAAEVAAASWCEEENQLNRGILDTWERYLEGQATDEETAAARQRAASCVTSLNLDLMPTNPASLNTAYLSCIAVACSNRYRYDDPKQAAVRAASDAARAAGHRALIPLGSSTRFRLDDQDNEDNPAYLAARNAERAVQCHLLRCIVSNPFRPEPTTAPAWLAWNDGAVRRMAQAIYDDRRFADLPILADALEDAGCTDAALLAHCRGPGAHVRGCWVVDLLTGRG